jgi:uncharacterized protein (TIGR02594 family)
MNLPMNAPRWLQVAQRYDGLAEVPGPNSNPSILAMARAIGAPAWFHDDDQPWCAVFQNAVLLEAGKPMAIGNRGDYFDRLRALTFHMQPYGQELAGPTLGAIGVFSRPDGAHVGMYLGECRDLVYVYGGNQANQACATWMRRDRVKSWRWPPGEAVPALTPIRLRQTGEPVSVNEQ